MSTPRVGVLLDIMGDEEALATVQRLERALKSLSGSRVRINAKKDIEALRKELLKIEAKKTKIKFETKDAESKIKRLKRSIDILNNAIKTRRGARGKILDERQIFRARTAVAKLNEELRRTQAAKINKSAEFNALNRQAAAARQQINLTRQALQNVTPLGQVFTSATAKISHVGSAMQSLGSAVNRIYQPIRWLLNGTVFAAGYKLMYMAKEGLSSSLERYDTMENYAKSMAALGEDANRKFVIGTGKAMTAVENLNEAVLGLPTGLNEIVDVQKRFYAASGDMEKATKMAIATNNAFLASGAQATEKLFGERQLRNLMSLGKLTQTQWQSLTRTMPLAMQSVAKELGYGKNGIVQMTKDINDGTLAVDDFIDTFTQLGTSGVISDAANVMKHSFQGVQANIQNAFSRMGYNLVKTFDQIFQKAYGKDTIDMMYSFRDVIDKASEGIQNWIKSDPDFFIDSIERLKKIDWKGLAKGFGEGLKMATDFIIKFLEVSSKLGTERIGKFLALSGLISNGLSIVGGALRGGRHILGFGAVGLFFLFRALGSGGLISKGFGKLKKMFTGITGLGKSAKTAEKATKGKAIGGLKGNLARWGGKFAGIATVLATIAATAGTIMISVKAIKEAIKDMGEISSDFYAVDWEVMAKVMTGFGIFVGAMYKVGQKIGKAVAANAQGVGYAALGTAIAGAFTTMVAGFGRLDIKLVKDSIKDMVTITEDVQTLAKNVNQLKSVKFKKDAVKNLVSELYDVYQIMFNTSGESLSEIKPRKTKKVADALDSLQDIFDSLKGIVSMLPKMYGLMDKASIQGSETAGRGATPFTLFKTQMQTLFGGLHDIMQSLNEDMLQGDFSTKQIGRFSEAMASVKSMFDSIGELVGKLPKIYESFTTLGLNQGVGKGTGGTDMFSTLIANLKTMFEGLGEVYETVNLTMNTGTFNAKDFASKLEAIASGVESIRKIGNKLAKLGGEGGSMADTSGSAFKAIGNIKTLINNLSKALGDADLGGLKEKVESFVSSVKSLLKQLSALGENGDNTISVEVTIEGKVKGKKALIDKITRAIEDIKAKCKTVTLTKKVNIKITRNVTVGGDSIPSNASLGGGGGFFHTGGYVGNGKTVYMAKGGNIFKAKGTDTVPAMLTHGEYVQKKSAVDFWGIKFMQKINNLDVSGAMKELSSKATHYMNVNRGTTINNNTTNNTDFTQNVYTSNPYFAFRRSSRYVGAL